MRKKNAFEDFVKSLEKLTLEQGQQLFIKVFILLLEQRLFQTLFVFLKNQTEIKKMICADELVYYAVDEIATTDSLQLLEKRKENLMEFWRYLQDHEPAFFAEVFRQCCLRHVDNDDWKDLSTFFDWGGFGAELPRNILSEWMKELFLFQAQMGPGSEDISRVIFTPEFSLRFARRTIGELHAVERNHYWNHLWSKEINKPILETFTCLAAIVDLIISRSIELKYEYSILMPPTHELFPRAVKQIAGLDESYGSAVKRLRECAAFFYVLNPEQFAKAVSPHKFSHFLDEFKQYYESDTGKEELLAKQWYRSLKGILELELKEK